MEKVQIVQPIIKKSEGARSKKNRKINSGEKVRHLKKTISKLLLALYVFDRFSYS